MNTENPVEEVCDCAPTDAERTRMWGSLSRRTALSIGAIGAASVVAVSAFGITHASPAFATITYDPNDYPTWEDVDRARSNESAKAGEISRIEAMIADLRNQVAITRAAHIQAADEYYAAQQAFLEAAYRADELQRRADEQAAKADEAAVAAARLTSKLSRTGGGDTSLEVMFAGSSENADELLQQLGQMDKLIERNEAVYAEAAAQRESAQALSDQADVARQERDRLQLIAQEKMIAAQNAQAAAEAALAAQEENLIVLEAQLSALRDTTGRTIEDYQAGVEQKRLYEEEQALIAERRREEEAERLAEAQRQRQREQEQRQREQEQRQREQQRNNNNNDGGSRPAPQEPAPQEVDPAPPPQSTGWTRPNYGPLTSGYGPRTQMCGTVYCSSSWHLGIDLAAGCGSPILAAANGTVVYAGYNGGYGNYIRLDHGNGVGTGYAHIVNGGLLVAPGQQISVGQTIAYEGNTGNSFGCHLHFEVYVGGGTTDPIPWLAARGVYI